MSKYFVIFGGGGIRGVAYCGAYKSLMENNIEISGLAGSSIGAVFATFLSIDYSCDEIYEILSETGLELFSDLNFDIKRELAFSKGQKFYEWMKNNIEKKYYKDAYQKGQMPPVKFSDIDKRLVIYAVDLAKMEFKEFSKELTPDFEIALAVRASVSMPGLFTPLVNNGSYIVDGDLLKSSPLWRVSDSIKKTKERILEFRLEDNSPKEEIQNTFEYANRVYNAFCGFATDYIIDLYGKKDKFDYIKINTPDISVVDFLIPKSKKQELFDIGYNATNEYINNILSAKKEELKIKYKKILDMFLKCQRKYLKKDYFGAYMNLCELFVYLCEEKRYIDTFVYEKIVEFKDLYFTNFKKTSIFNFNKGRITNNHTEIYNRLLEIIKILTSKIEEMG